MLWRKGEMHASTCMQEDLNPRPRKQKSEAGGVDWLPSAEEAAMDRQVRGSLPGRKA